MVVEGNYPKKATRDPLIGLTIDRRYTITDFVARGGTGTVYLAHDNRLDRFVALKTMHNQLTHDPLFLERFKREAQSAAQLDDPHVVIIHDQGEDFEVSGEDIIYLAMEYIDGYSLRQVLTHHQALDVSSALKILISTLKGLSAAHEAHIVHRDVKPENVLISSSGRVKLGDFGLAKSLTSTTHTGVLIGTIAYLAPETISTGSADERSDIYAIGVMLYEMLTGELPFPGDITQHIAYQHVNNTPSWPSEKIPELPATLDEIISWTMAKDPRDRPENAGVLLKEAELLQNSLTEEELSAHAPHMVTTPLKAKIARNTSLPTNINPPDKQVTRVINSQRAEETANLAESPQEFGAQVPADESIISILPNSELADIDSSSELDDAAASPTLSSTHHKKKNNLSSQRVTPKYSLSRSTIKTVAWIFLLTLLTILAAGSIWFFAAGPGATATIPETAGIDTEEAQKRLSQSGFSNIATEQVFDEYITHGTTIGTHPEAGQGERKFNLVTLRISKGPQLFKMPSLATLDLETTKKTIVDDGFVVGSIIEEWHETIPAGQVIRHVPHAGEQIRKKTAIELTVSKGKEPVAVPNVIGLSSAEATKALKKAGFAVETAAERDYHRTISVDHVIRQNPGNGTLPRGSTVIIWLSKGPRMIKVPDVRRMSIDDAVEKLEKLGFTVKRNNILGGILGLVQGQSPGNEELPEGSTITLNVV